MTHGTRVVVASKRIRTIYCTIFVAAGLLNVVLGLSSIGVQIAAMVTSNSIDVYAFYGFDYIGFGIWGGVCYLMAGSFAAYSNWKKTRLMMTFIMSGFAIDCSIVAATLSGMAASFGVSPLCHISENEKSCDSWVTLEWCLMAISVLAGINSIILIVTASRVFCCNSYTNSTAATVRRHQQVVSVGTESNRQPVYPKPEAQSVTLNLQQLPTFQVAYYPQIIEQSQPQPQQVLATAPPMALVTAPALQVQQH